MQKSIRYITPENGYGCGMVTFFDFSVKEKFLSSDGAFAGKRCTLCMVGCLPRTVQNFPSQFYCFTARLLPVRLQVFLVNFPYVRRFWA